MRNIGLRFFCIVLIFATTFCGYAQAISKDTVSCDGGASCPSNGFQDISLDSWYHSAVDYAVSEGLFQGISETEFAPEQPMTRAMMVTVLWRYSGGAAEGNPPFSDVPEDSWYTEAVAWAYENGIVTGVETDLFDPEGEITREQMATILYRFAAGKELDVSNTAALEHFGDAVQVSAYAKEALCWTYAEGIITGSDEDGTLWLLPGDSATRAQVAAILMRFAHFCDSQEGVLLLSTPEDFYALARLLASNTTKSHYLGGYDPDKDLERFDIPEELQIQAEKIEYLATASYRLTEDIHIVYSKEVGTTFFLGIGSAAYPFRGVFDGNHHTISLAQYGDLGADAWTENYLGLFNRARNAEIRNVDIRIEDDLIFTHTYTMLSYGPLLGLAQDTVVEHCSVTITNADVGAVFPDINPHRTFVMVGGLVGYAEGATEICNCEILLTNASLLLQEQKPEQTTQNELGGFVGRTSGLIDRRVTISDCKCTADNSDIMNYTASHASTGGCIGKAIYTDVNGYQISLTNSTLISRGDRVNMSAYYSAISTGGIIGFSNPGSSNADHIGALGNRLSGCTLISENYTRRDVISSVITAGAEVTAGGLVGCSFNNFVAEDCAVQISRGNIVARKTGIEDTAALGTQAGGIIGRMEHTGSLMDCTVTGDQLNIISAGAENESAAGGIVGADVGPYHRKVASLQRCSFVGNGTSSIILEVTASDVVEKPCSAGGIAGVSAYQILGCSVTDAVIVHRSAGVERACAGGIVGLFRSASGLWKNGEYFVPDLPGITDCLTEGLSFDLTDNVTAGKICGVNQ